jgi:protein phosphatase 2C family protein 2/3
MTRALGDFALKDRPDLPRNEQKIIPEPDITDHKIEDDTEFLVLASDGTLFLKLLRCLHIRVNLRFVV